MLRTLTPACWLLLPVTVAATLLASQRWQSSRPDGWPFAAGTRQAGDDGARLRAATVARRIGMKRQIIERVRDRDRTLFEAAAMFRQLDDATPSMHYYFPGATEEERYCQQVIGWLDAELESARAADRDEVVERARCELRAAMSCGPLTLPEVSMPFTGSD